jgi:hypothetical protein
MFRASGMRMKRIRFISIAGFAGLMGFAAPIHAAPAKPGNAAANASAVTELYAAAQKLFDKGNYSEALVAFRQVHNASNSPNARLMIGHCLIALGKNTEAYTEMAETLREATERAASEPKYAKTRDSAAAQVALLESKVGKVIVTAQDRTIDVTLNGTRIAPDNLGTPIAVDPGTAVIVGKRVDGRTVVRELKVGAGKTETVVVEFPADTVNAGDKTVKSGSDAAVGTPPPAPPVAGERRGGGVRIAGAVVFGVGAAGMIVFGVAGSMAKSKFATLETECGSSRCTDLKYADVIDSGKTLTTVANIGLIAGAAGLVGGGLMILLGGPSAAPPSRAAISIYPGGAGVQYALSF